MMGCLLVMTVSFIVYAVAYAFVLGDWVVGKEDIGAVVLLGYLFVGFILGMMIMAMWS